MNDLSKISTCLPTVTRALPASQLDDVTILAPALGGGSLAVAELLIRLTRNESALYAVIRDWRFDAAGHKCVRLHALLDAQFTEIGLRLVSLAKHGRDLGCESSDNGDRTVTPRPDIEDRHHESFIIRDLLARQEEMLDQLRRGQAELRALFNANTTIKLLGRLIVDHERDAFLLRALLWEVENTAV